MTIVLGWARMTPLICAAKNGRLEIIEMLLDVDGIDVNGREADG